jgi:hypothetical protein
MDPGDPHFVADITRFAKKFIKRKLPQITDLEVEDFEDWINNSNYPGPRRRYLLQLLREIKRIDSDVTDVEGFLKFEGYMKPKQARGINSYTDLSKCLLGRLIKAVDKKWFSLPYFVKGSNPRSWPDELFKRFGLGSVLTTDFTSFEAHHRDKFAEIIAFAFEHTLEKITGFRYLKLMIKALVLGKNKIKFPICDILVLQRLMSGALWTSSANGLLNLIIMMYLYLKSKYPQVDGADLIDFIEEFVGLVEGDDGICANTGMDDDLPSKISVILKWERHENYSTAGFCSIYCGVGSAFVVKDPLKILSSVGVHPMKYHGLRKSKLDALDRCWALSHAYAFPGCPILSSVCRWILDNTRTVDVSCILLKLDSRVHDHYIAGRQLMRQTRTPSDHYGDLFVPVTDESRDVVSRVFDFDHALQLEIEKAFNTTERVVYVDLDKYVDKQMLHHIYTHVVNDPRVYPPPLCAIVDVFKQVSGDATRSYPLRITGNVHEYLV